MQFKLVYYEEQTLISSILLQNGHLVYLVLVWAIFVQKRWYFVFCPTDSDDEEEEDEDIKTGFKPQVILEPKVDLDKK